MLACASTAAGSMEMPCFLQHFAFKHFFRGGKSVEIHTAVEIGTVKVHTVNTGILHTVDQRLNQFAVSRISLPRKRPLKQDLTEDSCICKLKIILEQTYPDLINLLVF